MDPFVLSLVLITLTGPTGARIDLNKEAVLSVRDPSAMPQGHFANGTRCIIVMSDGAAIPVAETCAEVRDKLDH